MFTFGSGVETRWKIGCWGFASEPDISSPNSPHLRWLFHAYSRSSAYLSGLHFWPTNPKPLPQALAWDEGKSFRRIQPKVVSPQSRWFRHQRCYFGSLAPLSDSLAVTFGIYLISTWKAPKEPYLALETALFALILPTIALWSSKRSKVFKSRYCPEIVCESAQNTWFHCRNPLFSWCFTLNVRIDLLCYYLVDCTVFWP